jgi:hypothetical protein
MLNMWGIPTEKQKLFFKAHEKARKEKYNIKVKSSFNLLNSRLSTRQKKGLMSIKSGPQKLFKLKHKAKNILKGNRLTDLPMNCVYLIRVL